MREWNIIPSEEIPIVWGIIAHWVDQACEASYGKYSPKYFLQILLNNQSQLWMDADKSAAIITDIIFFPHKKYARLVMGMGKDPQDLADFITTFEDWAKNIACDGVLSEMRLGLTPPFINANWKKTHVLMEKEL